MMVNFCLKYEVSWNVKCQVAAYELDRDRTELRNTVGPL